MSAPTLSVTQDTAVAERGAKIAGGDPPRRSLLRRAILWRLLLGWAVSWGLLTWGMEAAILRQVPDAPHEPLGGIYRLVESLLGVILLTIVIGVAERWPITHPRRHARRIAAQAGLALVVGPVWGVMAYALSPYLMPWWTPRGMWGIVAKEAKGMLFGYGTSAVLAHVLLYVLAQRQRALAAAQATQQAAEARLDLLRLELQPERMLRALDDVIALIPRDVDAANTALVLFSDSLSTAMDGARTRELPLHDELARVREDVRLHHLARRNQVQLVESLAPEASQALVPQGLVQDLVDEVCATAAQLDVSATVQVTGQVLDRAFLLELCVMPLPSEAATQLLQRLARGRAVATARERLRQLADQSAPPNWDAAADPTRARLLLRLPWRA